MAENNSTSNDQAQDFEPSKSASTAEVSRGADTCLAALRAMEAMSMVNNSTWQQHWQDEKAAIDLLVRASGTDSLFLIGFLSVLGEYVHCVNVSGTPNLEPGTWTPRVMMTDEEFRTFREKCEAESIA